MQKAYKGYLIDLDGTVYMGKNRIPTAEVFIEELKCKGVPFLFLTNNATRTAPEQVKHLASPYGITVGEKAIYTSGMATVDYLLTHYAGQTLFVISEPALKEQLLSAGFTLTDQLAEIDVVVQSYCKTLIYEDLAKATLAIHDGADFIVTNEDSNLPSERGMVPGSGATTAYLKAATGKEPIIIGKPHHIIMDGALEKIGLLKEEVALIGDNYTTDILAGINYGMDTIMVLTGFSSRESIVGKEQPTYIINDLSEWTL